MRKYKNVDVVACLGAVMEINTENYKSDFKDARYMFYKAAENSDGENSRFLWMSRRSGTECFLERDVYLMPSYAYEAWQYYANNNYEAPRAYAVEITGLDSGRVRGDIWELDYRTHAMKVKKYAQAICSVDVLFADGTRLDLPYRIWDADKEPLFREHGNFRIIRKTADDEYALQKALAAAYILRESECRPAVFKVAIQHEKRPSIRLQLADGKQQLAEQHNTAPQKAPTRPQGMEV
jgi:hypothetical protein